MSVTLEMVRDVRTCGTLLWRVRRAGLIGEATLVFHWWCVTKRSTSLDKEIIISVVRLTFNPVVYQRFTIRINSTLWVHYCCDVIEKDITWDSLRFFVRDGSTKMWVGTEKRCLVTLVLKILRRRRIIWWVPVLLDRSQSFGFHSFGAFPFIAVPHFHLQCCQRLSSETNFVTSRSVLQHERLILIYVRLILLRWLTFCIFGKIDYAR